MDFSTLADSPRLLMQVDLQPVQGSRFQPTEFPDLDAAEYKDHEGTRMLLLESAQSMANRLEEVCWNEADQTLVDELDGLPYVHSQVEDDVETNSILEAHRLNSPYIVKSTIFENEIEPAIGFEKNKPFDRLKLARALLKYDVNCLLHGVFLEKIAGVVRLPRAVSGFIEATNIEVAPSGGAKVDRIQPATQGETTKYGKAKEGYGNVPFHRDEYTGDITAFFNLDLAQIRGYGFDAEVENLLIGLALYKIKKFLHEGLRLRTACDLETKGDLRVTRPDDFNVPSLGQLVERVPEWIDGASDYFADPAVTKVSYDK